MANDDLTGVAVAVNIAKELSKKKNHYTYKFLFLPETIGSTAFLSQNEDLIPKFKAGLYLEMLGNDNGFALQHSRQGNERIDRIARYVMKKRLKRFREGAFRKIVRNDEMVFNGPGVNIPMISISRFPYPEYHTSDDNMGIISAEKLEEAKELVVEILRILDADFVPKRKFKGTVFLSGYGLWVDWRENMELNKNLEQIMLRLEGDKSVFDIAEELEMDFDTVRDHLEKFYEKDLVEKID
jgi:aminopeptidase-like protein